MSNSNNIDLALSNFTCEKDISILESVFKDYGLKEYFHAFCVEFGILDYFGNYSNYCEMIKGGKSFTDFYYICIKACLVFEGCKHNHVSYKETQIGLLYSLFSCKLLKNNLIEIHNSIAENKRIDTNQFTILSFNIGKKSFRNVSDLHAVLIDTKEMFPYWAVTGQETEIQTALQTYRKKMPSLSAEEIINNVFINIKKITWKTRWGKMKAFNRNYQKVVENLRQATLNGTIHS